MTTTPVTIEQAAALLGVSASTIRRRIRAGTLQVTETRRPQGTVWLVHLPPGVRPASATDTVDTAPVDTAPTAQPAPAESMALVIQTTIATVLGPLVAELGASRQANERQAGEIADLREQRGRQTAELERAASTIVALNASLEARTASEAATSTREPLTARSWTMARWGLTLVAITGAVVAAMALLAWLGWP